MPIPEFVLSMRAKVGTDLLWMPGVSAVVVGADGKLLLGRRADNGLWAVVSGILEPGEQPAHAVVREALEETGVHVRVDGLASFYSDARTIVYENGDRAQYLDLTFACTAIGGQAQVGDDESTEVGWFDPDALPTPLAPSSKSRLAHARAYLEDPAAGPSYAR